MFIKLHKTEDGQEYLLNGSRIIAIYPQKSSTLISVAGSEKDHRVRETVPQILEQVYRKV